MYKCLITENDTEWNLTIHVYLDFYHQRRIERIILFCATIITQSLNKGIYALQLLIQQLTIEDRIFRNFGNTVNRRWVYLRKYFQIFRNTSRQMGHLVVCNHRSLLIHATEYVSNPWRVRMSARISLAPLLESSAIALKVRP